MSWLQDLVCKMIMSTKHDADHDRELKGQGMICTDFETHLVSPFSHLVQSCMFLNPPPSQFFHPVEKANNILSSVYSENIRTTSYSYSLLTLCNLQPSFCNVSSALFLLYIFSLHHLQEILQSSTTSTCQFLDLNQANIPSTRRTCKWSSLTFPSRHFLQGMTTVWTSTTHLVVIERAGEKSSWARCSPRRLSSLQM